MSHARLSMNSMAAAAGAGAGGQAPGARSSIVGATRFSPFADLANDKNRTSEPGFATKLFDTVRPQPKGLHTDPYKVQPDCDKWPGVNNAPFNLLRPMAPADVFDDKKILVWLDAERRRKAEEKKAKDEQERRLFGGKMRTTGTPKSAAGSLMSAIAPKAVIGGVGPIAVKNPHEERRAEQQALDSFKQKTENMLLNGLLIRLIRYETFSETLSYWFFLTDSDKSGLLSYDEVRTGLYLMFVMLLGQKEPFYRSPETHNCDASKLELPEDVRTAELQAAMQNITVAQRKLILSILPDENQTHTLASRWFDANKNEGIKRSIFQHIFYDCLEQFYRSLARLPFCFSEVERDDTPPTEMRAMRAMWELRDWNNQNRGGYDPRFPIYSACKAFWKKQQADERQRMASEAVNAASSLFSHIATSTAAGAPAAGAAGGAGGAAAAPTDPATAAAAATANGTPAPTAATTTAPVAGTPAVAGAAVPATGAPAVAGAPAGLPALTNLPALPSLNAPAPAPGQHPAQLNSANAKTADERKTAALPIDFEALKNKLTATKNTEPTAVDKANAYAWDLLLIDCARHLQARLARGAEFHDVARASRVEAAGLRNNRENDSIAGFAGQQAVHAAALKKQENVLGDDDGISRGLTDVVSDVAWFGFVVLLLPFFTLARYFINTKDKICASWHWWATLPIVLIGFFLGVGMYYVGFVQIALYYTAGEASDEYILNPDGSRKFSSQAELMSNRFGFLEVFLPFLMAVVVAFMLVTFRFATNAPVTKKNQWLEAQVAVSATDVQRFKYDAQRLTKPTDVLMREANNTIKTSLKTRVAHIVTLTDPHPRVGAARHHVTTHDHPLRCVLDPQHRADRFYQCVECMYMYRGYALACDHVQCMQKNFNKKCEFIGYHLCPRCFLTNAKPMQDKILPPPPVNEKDGKDEKADEKDGLAISPLGLLATQPKEALVGAMLAPGRKGPTPKPPPPPTRPLPINPRDGQMISSGFSSALKSRLTPSSGIADELVETTIYNLAELCLTVQREDKFLWYDYVLAVAAAAGHCIIPGLYRVYILDVPFGGIRPVERALTALHIICMFICVGLSGWALRKINGLYINRFKRLTAVIAVTSARGALQAGLAGYLELDSAVHLASWWKVRALANTTRPEHNSWISFLGPMLIANVALLATMIIRVVILQARLDAFNILGFYDMVVLDLYLVAIIMYVVKCNNALDGHIKMLEAEKLKIAKQTMITEGPQKAQFEQLTILMESLVAKMRAIPDYVKILGVTITGAEMTKFLGAILTGIASALAKLISSA